MSTLYDIVIIGGGPSGLALAQCCASLGNKKILIIEREDDIGGCHRVKRVDVKNNKGIVEKMFTEHSPRVYSSTYKVFMDLLHKMDLNFYDLFTPYNFSLATIGGETIWTTLSFSEMFSLFLDFLILLINDNYGINMSMQEYVHSRGFSPAASDMIDRICRLTDGATSDKYTLNEFLQLFNQQALYTLYQPKRPNDIGLFSLWKSYLEKQNVDFLLRATVEKLNLDSSLANENTIRSLHCNYDNKNIEIIGKQFIIATPPTNLVKILENSKSEMVQNAFGDLTTLTSWSEKTDYIDYISVTFHWDTVLDLEKIYGFPKTEWGVAFVVMSDYIKFDESQSKTVISATATITNYNSKTINKTANQCNDKTELVEEIFNQLKVSFPNLPKPSTSILSPELSWSDGRWESLDTAFIASSNQSNLDFSSKTISNLFNVGTHNGRNIYKFTSMESAVTNAVILSHILYPELKKTFNIPYSFTTRSIIMIFILSCIIYVYF